jgi:cellulose synthase/poly-beta-1,6-N-acetylglucosamine synthase-like glycosyltransferase
VSPAPHAPPPRIEHVAVVVPARDEERLLPLCLASVLVAAAGLQALASGPLRRPGSVDVVLALDSCTDGSPEVARRFPVRVVELGAGSVGAARRAGARTALRAATAAAAPFSATWLACTDADTTVSPDWLVRHVAAADAGADAVLGTVEPDAAEDSALARAWPRLHHLREGHPHVHGANLGVRADAYLAVGGFGDRAVDEDVELVARLRRAGRTCVATDRVRVRTSSRRAGRVPHGFSSYLAALGASPLLAPAPEG